MKAKMKLHKLLSLLLTLVMLLSLVPAMGVTASAAEPEWTTVSTYGQLKDAVDKGSAKIKLTADISSSNFVEGVGVTPATNLKFKGSGNVLDLNGYKLTLVSNMGTNFIELTNADLTIKDSGTNGRIDIEYRSVVGVQQAILIDNTGSLTVDGGTLSSSYRGIILIDSAGSITINGGRLYAPVTNSGSSDYVIFSTHSYKYNDTLQLHVNGGEIDGRVVLKRDDSSATGTLKYKVTPIKITGGTFKQGLYATWGMGNNPEGAPKNAEMTMDSPTVEITGGVFEKNNDDDQRESRCYIDLATKLRGGTFKDSSTTIRFVGGEYTWDGTQPQYRASIGNSAILYGNDIRTAYDWSESEWFKIQSPWIYLYPKGGNSVTVIRDAWGMKSVTLDGKEINYAKDWKGTVERMDNSTAHTLKFEWYPLASELVNAGYTYRANFDCYTVGSNTPTTSVPISATAAEYSHTIRAGEAPSVYPFDLQLNLDKNGSSVGIISNQHIVKLVVSEAPPAPPAPVAHSITVTNGRGTANTTSAFAGDTVTVTAKDDTANNMMFTRWNTETAGVTFADATKQETTFVMPDCDVKVNPGFQQVLFTKQPVPQISLEQGYGGKTSFVFSWDISKWELVDTATNQTVSSDNTLVKAGKLTDVTIPANTDLGSKNYRIVVTTANGEQFKSNDFIVTWFEKMPAPLVEFSIPSGTKFIGELTVNVGYPSTLNNGSVSPYEMRYTTNGVDPKDANPSDVEECPGSTDVTLTGTTKIMARTILEGEGGNEDTWGELCEATYTMIDKLDAPTVTPTSCRYSGSLPIIVTIQDVYNAKISYTVKQHDGYLSGKEVDGPMLKTGLPDTFCGTTTFSAKAIVYKDGGGAWESDEVTYTYTREYWANISNATISGKVNKAIADTDVTITLDGEKFKDVAVGDDVSGWFNLPAGLTAKVKEQTSYSRELVITISGTPTATSAAAITVTIPKDKLLANGTVDLTVLSNPKAVYNIGTDVAHTHDYTGQPYLYLDPGNHYQECTAGDGYNIQAHAFTPWTDNGNGTHSRHCTVCKMTDGSTYTETANHNWQWVVDTAATPNAAGKQHEECVDCHVKRSENTEIPMLTSIMVEHLTVAKPVKDAAAAIANTTDSSYTVANTEWMAADGTPIAIGGKFQPGTVYTVKITLETAGAGVFSVKSTYNTIEGKTATVNPALTGDNHADSVILTYTFDATEGTYVPTKHTVSVKTDGNGTASASPTSAVAGTKITLSATANSGYHFKEWQVVSGGVTITNNKFTMPDEAVEVKAIFEKNASTGGGGGGGVSTYPITVKSAKNGDVTASHKTASKGTAVTLTVDPDKGYVLDTLTVLDGKDKEIKLTEKNGKFTFTMPASKVTVAATFKASAPTGKNPFIDVPAGSYYEDAVIWAVDKGITTGTSATTFNPNGICTRAQAVTFLWRAAGSPAAKSKVMPFADVKAGSYYYDAVLWAMEQGITKGTSDTTFTPNAKCTRAQIVTFLWRSQKSPASDSVNPFTDVAADAYYNTAVLWAAENGITGGTSATTFSPNNDCTRAQIVTFLFRCLG